MRKTYTKGQIVTMVPELKANQVKYYTEQQVIIPEPYTGEGTGHSREYSIESVFHFSVIAKLAKYSLKLKHIKLIIDILRNIFKPGEIEENIEALNENISLGILTLIITWDDENLIGFISNDGLFYDEMTAFFSEDGKHYPVDLRKRFTDAIILDLTSILENIKF